MSEFTKEQLARIATDTPSVFKAPTCGTLAINLARFALELMERAETAEKRMKAWGCPDFDFICLNCGRETPCITEADLRPGDPGVPCTFDLTYPQMIERLRHYEDRQRKAEADRDRLREELESSNRQLENFSSGLSDALEQRDKAREKLRALQEKSDRHESERDSFRLEADRLREELREAEARALRNRVGGMLEAAEVVRKLRPKEACTCGNYLDFRNGVPGHLPGCLVGECIDAADEIDGRAEEIARGDRE